MSAFNVDLFGIARGRCKEVGCDCERYTVLASANVRCDYCDHCPGSHGRLDELGSTGAPAAGNALSNVLENSGQARTFDNGQVDHGGLDQYKMVPSSLPGCSKDSTMWNEEWRMNEIDPTQALELEDSGENYDLPTTTPEKTAGTSSSTFAIELPHVSERSPSDLSQLPKTSTSDVSPQLVKSSNSAPFPPMDRKQFFEWLLLNMPTFSACVQPLLQGKQLPARDHKMLCRQLRTEITLFLDENNLITSSNSGQCRWKYKALGDALLKIYPNLTWDEPKPQSRMQATRSQVYSAFMTRLSTARKVRKYRARRNEASCVTPAPQPMITKENAASELQALSSSTMAGVSLDMERVRTLLTMTFPDRRKGHVDPLPPYFLVEEILCIEVELRFNANIARLESKLSDVVEVFSETEERVCTLVDVMKHIQGNVGHSLINETELPGDELQISAPHIYCTPDKVCVFAGSQAEVISVSTSGLPRALVFCLLVYYIKNLEYPFAYSQMLALVQKIALPGDRLQKSVICGRLKRFLAFLKQKNVI